MHTYTSAYVSMTLGVDLTELRRACIRIAYVRKNDCIRPHTDAVLLRSRRALRHACIRIAYVSIRCLVALMARVATCLHTYSIRQHTSAYVRCAVSLRSRRVLRRACIRILAYVSIRACIRIAYVSMRSRRALRRACIRIAYVSIRQHTLSRCALGARCDAPAYV